ALQVVLLSFPFPYLCKRVTTTEIVIQLPFVRITDVHYLLRPFPTAPLSVLRSFADSLSPASGSLTCDTASLHHLPPKSPSPQRIVVNAQFSRDSKSIAFLK